MNHNQCITSEYFSKRLVNLCLRSGLMEFPKGLENLHILLKSALLVIEQSQKSDTFSEQEINESLKYWINDITQLKIIDHVTLRRYLIDAGYLRREADGSCYQVSSPGPQKLLFDENINQIDLMELMNNAREEIIQKKREYLEKNRMIE